MSEERTPGATYRVQLTADRGLQHAADQVDYLAQLGITHLYTSPFLQAVPGSAHGYDVVDPTTVNVELGGEAGRAALLDALRRSGLGIVIDVVPNHLATDPVDNPWWRDVLRRGRASRFARFFDIDWSSQDAAVDDRIVLAVLEGPLEDEVAAGRVAVRPGGDGRDEWLVEAAGRDYPIDPATAPPDGSAPTGAAVLELLARQHYVLVDWRQGGERLNYRRFFDVADLVGIRVEDPAVFDETHRLLLAWVQDAAVDGLRIDHPDGLADPMGYLRRLREHAPDVWIVAEKILVDGEQLADDWPVDGTTGYDALALLTSLLVEPDGEPALTLAYEEALGRTQSFADLTRATRLQVMDELLVPEVNRLARALAAVAANVGLRADMAEAVAVAKAFLAEMPVYRTYTWPSRGVSDQDRHVIEEAGRRAGRDHPGVSPMLLDLLTTAVADTARQALDPAFAELARLVQQTSGPVMAKGVEDTALYRYTRFVALNDVGCDPTRFGLSIADFHGAAACRVERWPRSMVTTSTHDTKRSEDVRARLAVLSEVADEWAGWTREWIERGAQLWPSTAPRDPTVELLVHQTIVGSYPLEPERLHDYVTKSSREAKRRTRWLETDDTFERALHEFVDVLLASEEYASQLERWWHRLLVPGRVNALAQKLLALTMPGVPDVYQGTELWSLDLVDPDNRRPVDYDMRRELLARLRGGDAPDGQALAASLADPADPGTAKLAVVHRALTIRRDRAASFVGAAATYSPLIANGPAADHVVAYLRGGDVAVVVARFGLCRERDGGWRDTALTLPPGAWHNAFDATVVHGSVPLAQLLTPFPVALLLRS